MNNAANAPIWGIELGGVCSYAACEGVAPVSQWMPLDLGCLREHELVRLFGSLHQALSAAAGFIMPPDVVVAVPAALTLKQRQTVVNAAKQAGLHVLRVLNLSEAVALSRIAVGAAPEGYFAVCAVGDGYVEAATFDWEDGLLEDVAVSPGRFAQNQGMAAEPLMESSLFTAVLIADTVSRDEGEGEEPLSYLLYYAADAVVLPFTSQAAVPERWSGLPRVNAAQGAAALGAVYFGSIARGEADVLLLQALASGLGLEAGDGSVISLLKSEASIPTKATQDFVLQPGQAVYGVHLLEGNGLRAEDCESLGWFTLEGLSTQGAAPETIEVTLDIDAMSHVDITLRHVEADVSRTWRVASLGSTYVPRPQSVPAPTDPNCYASVELTWQEAFHGCKKELEHACVVLEDGMFVEHSQTVSVSVPAGVREGQTLRLSGQGNATAQSAVRGDLMVEVQVKYEPEFTLSGDDVYLNEAVELTQAEAAVGCVRQVLTPSGAAESVTVPGGLAEGVWTRARGLGLKQVDGTRGDLYFWMRFV